MGTDIGMESTDKEAIQKYYGWESASPDNSSSSSEEEGEVDLEDRILTWRTLRTRSFSYPDDLKNGVPFMTGVEAAAACRRESDPDRAFAPPVVLLFVPHSFHCCHVVHCTAIVVGKTHTCDRSKGSEEGPRASENNVRHGKGAGGARGAHAAKTRTHKHQDEPAREGQERKSLGVRRRVRLAYSSLRGVQELLASGEIGNGGKV